MLKWFDEVLSSQMKLCRVKQRERGSHGYLNKRYVFLKSFVIRFIPAACVLS